MNKVVLISVVVLVLLGVAIFSVFWTKPVKTPTQRDEQTNTTVETKKQTTLKIETKTVTYTDSGFAPQNLEVAKGSTVNFINQTQLPMWVASAPHPEHTDYPELDAGVIAGDHIAPGNPSFSFKFDKPGTWSYHNHSAPEHEAVIIVK